MSRSNGPIGQPGGGQPPFRRPANEADAATRPGHPGNGSGPASYGPAGYAPSGYGNAPEPAPRHAPAAFGGLAPAYPNQPTQGAEQGYYPAGQSSAQQSYQPVFDRYAPPQDQVARGPDPAQRGYDPRMQVPRTAPVPQPSQGYGQSSAGSSFDPQAGLRGAAYDQWPQPQNAAAGLPQGAAAPRGYDFSNYAPTGAPGREPVRDYGVTPPTGRPSAPSQPHAPHNHAAEEAQWQLAGAYDRRNDTASEANGYGGQAYGQPQTYSNDQGYAPEGAGQLQHADDQQYDQDDNPDYEDDEPRKGRRGLIMVSALVGAIAIGGGMAYAYKTFIKPSSGGQVAKLTAPKGPAKVQPVEPGGKQFPNQDSKLQNRLGDGSSTAAPSDGEGGVRRVPVLSVGRDGSMSAPVPAQPAAAVPGMVVQMPAAAPPAPTASQAAPVAASVVAAATASAPVAQPRAVVPQARVNVPVADPDPVAPIAGKKVAVTKKPLAARDDLVASNGAPSAAAAAPAIKPAGGRGFVAVIASKGSRSDAQKANTDMEQKFDVLKGKVFDVQEADLTAQGKGVVFRSVVGPPGSRQFASGICEQLKGVGYASCWITNY